MKKLRILFFLLAISIASHAQFTQYIIEFKDKTGSPYSVSKPQEFLSQRAIDRRNNQKISIDENDLPVNPFYIDSIRSSGNVIIKNVSKWLNQVCIETTDEQALQKISSFSFVKNTGPAKRIFNKDFISKKKFEEPGNSEYLRRSSPVNSLLKYGVSEKQIAIHKGDLLHDKGFTGNGMLIAVIDDGFYHYKSLPAFDSIRINDRIVDTFDFVGNKNGLNEEDAHGMYCLSLIASNVPGQMIGSAPGASFLLYRSENVSAEYLAEEQNWIAAVERSDSAGADVISTSLGYSTFDNPVFNHSYSDMDGNTTMMSKVASMVGSKGIILLVAAGNEGNKTWHYITAPADALNVLTVGAVDVSGVPGSFSSYGPTSDGRQKPDVSSVGVAAYVQAVNGGFGSGNGTSFATPNLAGLVTCLWQAFPEFNAFEIMEAVKKSSNKFSNPDNQMGYGIPDFEIAYGNLFKEQIQRRASIILKDQSFMVFPNPMTNAANLLIKPAVSGTSVIKWFDVNGRLCFQQKESFQANEVTIVPLKRNGLQRGIYFLKFEIGKKDFVQKVIIQ